MSKKMKNVAQLAYFHLEQKTGIRCITWYCGRNWR